MTTPESRRLVADLVLFHKFVLGKVIMQTDSVTYNLSVRGDKPTIGIQRHVYAARSGSLFMRVSPVYSKLPDRIRSLTTISGFHSALLLLDLARFATFHVKRLCKFHVEFRFHDFMTFVLFDACVVTWFTAYK